MDKLAGVLGLVNRSGNIKTGAEVCEKILRKNKGLVLLLANDASGNTSKKFMLMAERNTEIFVIRKYSKRELSEMLGKCNLTVAVIKDEKLSQWILANYNE